MKCGLLPIALLPFIASAQETRERPNILFCIADDASRTSFGPYGCRYCNTPAVDSLAANGIVFTNAYTQNPKSAPSRACLVTGMYSWQLKEAANHWSRFPGEFRFYPHILMENGYHVGFTGKGWGPGVYETEYNPAGPEYNGIVCRDVPAKGISRIDYAGNFRYFLEHNPEGRPFCFWLGAKEPHRWYEQDSWKRTGKDMDSVDVQPFLPDNGIVKGDLLDYAVEVEWFDTHIGRAVRILEEKGLLDNTLIIVTSDHGMPFPRVKGQIYDEAFHVPFIAFWKGKIMPGRVVSDFIGFHDVAPTILETAGLPMHPQMSGKSFLDILLSEKDGRVNKKRDHMILCKERHDLGRADEEGVNLGYPVRAIRTDEWLYVRNYEPSRWPVGNPEYNYRNCDDSPTKSYLTSLKPDDPDYRLFELCFGMRKPEELYDMQNDPHCMNNLAEDPGYGRIKNQLRRRMEKELKDSGDPRMYGKGYIFDSYPYMNARSGFEYIYHKTSARE